LAKYGKSYTSKDDYGHRFEIFAANYHRVMNHNMMNSEEGHWLGINAFADFTNEEYKQLLGYTPNPDKTLNY